MLCVLSFSSIISRCPRAVSVYPIARTRTMSNLAAGKKAAAVKAVDDYVKVRDSRPIYVYDNHQRQFLTITDQSKAGSGKRKHHCVCSGTTWQVEACVVDQATPTLTFSVRLKINLINFVPQLKELNKRNLRWYVFLHHFRPVSSSLTTGSLWVTWRHIQR